jgi:putative DNA primase/helicase
MKRKLPGEKVERLRDPSKVELFAVLLGCLSRWSADNGLKLAGADPAVPECLHDRAADNWRTLISIADAIGGGWPAKARKAAETLAGETLGDADSTRAMLLADLRSIFEAEREEVLQSEVIVGHLERMEHRPWPEWKHGKPMTVRQLAKMLSPFGIAPDQHWTNGRNRRGYSLAQCLDAFGRYLPSGTARTLEPAPNEAFSQEPRLLGNENLADRKIAGNPHEISVPPTLADENPRPAEAGYPKPIFHGLGDDEFPPIGWSR